MSLNRRRLLGAGAMAFAVPGAGLQGCASAPDLPPIPAELVDAALVPGYPAARQFADRARGPLADLWGTGMGSSFERHDEMAGHGPLRVLAISGGGSNGAFSAGVLTGWTAAGTRPVFDIVTGVSAGALAAPYALLGPAYDRHMDELFTGLSSSNIVKSRPRLLAIFSDALASPDPLRELIEHNFDAGMMRAVAREHQRGRRLFVGTTHVYAGRLVTWDIGAIAASGKPDSLALIHRVLLATASIPVMLPPVYFEVEAAGSRYHEMHMDGSMTRQVFVSSPGLDWRRVMRVHEHPGTPEFYVIRNGRSTSEYMVMAPRVTALGEHTMHLLTQSQGLADLYVIYLQAQRAAAQYRAAWIGDEFEAPWDSWYDPKYMRALFEYGREGAASGRIWHALPPGLEAGP